jgi:hypothetical protein
MNDLALAPIMGLNPDDAGAGPDHTVARAGAVDPSPLLVVRHVFVSLKRGFVLSPWRRLRGAPVYSRRLREFLAVLPSPPGNRRRAGKGTEETTNRFPGETDQRRCCFARTASPWRNTGLAEIVP